MTDHWQDCWRMPNHQACAIIEIERLRAELKRVHRERQEEVARLTPKAVTHDAFIPVHGEGPTWHGCNDDPPSKTL